MRTATNKNTGEQVYLDEGTNSWVPLKTATNKSTGEKIYFDSELSDWKPLVTQETNNSPEGEMASHSNPIPPPMASHASPMAKQPLWPISKNAGDELKTKLSNKIIEPATRMILEGGSMTLAELAATPYAVASGNPYAIVAAGSVGYASGKSAADTIFGKGPNGLRELAERFPQDMKTGAQYSLAGQILAPVLLWGGEKIYALETGIRNFFNTKLAAGRKFAFEFKALDKPMSIYAANKEEAEALQKEIPGLELTTAQQTNIPNLVSSERQLTRQGQSDVKNQYLEKVSKNTEAVSRYFESKFPGQGIEDVIPLIQKKQAELVAAAAEKQKSADSLAILMKTEAPEGTAEKLINTLNKKKAEAKREASKLYAKVPEDTKVQIDPMLKKFKVVSKKIGKYDTGEEIPSAVTNVLSKEQINPQPRPAGFTARDVVTVNGKKYATVKDLQRLEIQLKDEVRQAKATNAKGEYIKNLNKAKKAVTEAITEAEAGGEAGRTLKVANQFFKKEVVEKYLHGPVGQILTTGSRGEVSKVPLYEVPGRIWRAANDAKFAETFVKAVGPEDAQSLMRDHAAYDLVQGYGHGKTGFLDAADKTKYLAGWINRNKKILNRFDISKDFSSIAKAQSAAEAAKNNLTVFEQSAARAALPDKVDARIAIQQALGTKSIRNATQELYDIVKDSPAGLAGLQKSFADHVANKVELNAEIIAKDFKMSYDKLANIVKLYEPGYKILFKDNPEKLAALYKITDALRIQVRTARSSLGGGTSETYEFAAEAGKRLQQVALLNRLWSIAKGAVNIAGSIKQNMVNEVMLDATLNPNTAYRIAELAKQKDAWKFTPQGVKISPEATQVFDDLYRQILQRRQLYVGAATGGAAAMGGEAINGLQR